MPIHDSPSNPRPIGQFQFRSHTNLPIHYQSISPMPILDQSSNLIPTLDQSLTNPPKRCNPCPIPNQVANFDSYANPIPICQSLTYPPAQCQYMNNRHIQISSTIVPNYYQSLANLPLLGHSAKPMPILGKSVNLIKPISHTRTDKCGAKLVSNANSPIWYQSWTNPPIHCQSFANPMPILDQSSDQLQVHLPIQWQSWINQPIQWHSCTHLPIRQQARLWGLLKIPHLPHILNMVAHRPITHSSHINCSWQFV